MAKRGGGGGAADARGGGGGMLMDLDPKRRGTGPTAHSGYRLY
jgi:hypothetical protein